MKPSTALKRRYRKVNHSGSFRGWVRSLAFNDDETAKAYLANKAAQRPARVHRGDRPLTSPLWDAYLKGAKR